MKLYCVVHAVGGFAREDSATPAIAGVFSSEEVANKVKLCVSGALVQEIELDLIQPGYLKAAQELLGVNLAEILEKSQAGLRPMSSFDQECVLTASHFSELQECGAIIYSDGDGYWATEKEVSQISCFENKPGWATHVCWYNN